MASSSGIDAPHSAMAEYEVTAGEEEKVMYNMETHREAKIEGRDSDSSSIKRASDSTHRQLRPRHIQLIGIGGTIGTALYVQIGHGLLNGGPGSLFLAFTIWYVRSRIFCIQIASPPF
jgi:amino acid transporter